MTPTSDRADAIRLAVVMAIGVAVVLGLIVWGLWAALPSVEVWVDAVFSPGLGLKTAAIIGAAVSLLVLVVLTVMAGDGLLGEIQFVIPGFFLFFLFFWLMTAWVF